MRDMIRIGNGQGFWGDSIDAPFNLVTGGPLDYLTLDYLAEVTMSIMQRQRQKDPKAGFARDFPEMLRRVLPICRERGIKIVSNAGGVNNRGCFAACEAVINDLGFKGITMGFVEGDDIMDRLDELLDSGVDLKNMDTGSELRQVRDAVMSANVYLDSFAIADALNGGADIVVTGRCTDPGLALGPCIHEFGWEKDEYNLLAAGTVAGHILECGVQSTGGNFSRWREVPDMANIGYPVAEVTRDGDIIITKHEGTGGMVTVDTVSEQLLYELGDPKNYITPDVVVDFTSIKVDQAGADRVAVSGIKGLPATPTFKVSISYSNGWKASGQLTISGPEAAAKCELVAEIVKDRLLRAGCEYDEYFAEIIGQERHSVVGDRATDRVDSLALILSVKDRDREKVARFGMELAPVITSGPPGVTGFAAGRPKPKEVVAYWPALIDKSLIKAQVIIETIGG